MKEVRVGWKLGLHENARGEPTDGGVWFADTPENRRETEIIVQCGNEVAGAGSHWLEERDNGGDHRVLTALGVDLRRPLEK